MNIDDKEKIIKGLKSKKVNLPCPRCEAKKFEIVGQTLLALNEDPNALVIGGPAIPSAIIACSNCGFIMLHALIALTKEI